MLYDQISKNKRKTFFLLFFFFLLVELIGMAVGYFMNNIWLGTIIAAVFAVIYMIVTASQSIEIVMAMNHAKKIDAAKELPQLYHVVEDMAMVAKIPMPEIYLVEDDSPNAFATGNKPEKSAVAVTSGLLQRLNREELEGVIGHEVSHIRNYDIRLSTIAMALASAVSLLAQVGTRFLWFGGGRRDSDSKNGNPIILIISLVLIILAPLAATIAQLALSRNREYLADASAVELTRNPVGLISALQKISQSEPMSQNNVNDASAGMYFSEPVKQTFSNLFATHPPTEKRIERLEQMYNVGMRHTK